MAEFSFEIQEHVGVLSEKPNGWSKELTRVSWNGREAKYDIRDWSSDYSKMGKGITFTEEELRSLHNLLEELFN